MTIRVDDAVAALARLAPLETRAQASAALARQLGADSLLLLVYNDEARVLLPAAGSPKTLPGGAAWRRILARCIGGGIHRGELSPAIGADAVGAAACSDGKMALVFLGGEVADEALAAFIPALPLLATLLHEQQLSAIAKGELVAARFEMRQYASLARALDEARGEVDRTLREFALQARRLDEARVHAEQAARAKDHFLAMLGHELRNPLAPIVTVLQLLQRRGQWLPEYAIMQRQVDHMQRLVDDLLDVARIAGGKLTLERRVVELIDVIRSAHEIAHPLLSHKRQHIELDIPPSGLPVDADPARLAQVFGNLLTNASKYSDANTRITVSARKLKHEIEIVVSDEGIGLRPEMLDRVFDIFEQQSGGIDRAEGGLGLGLAIVRNLVQQHGGHVHAESAGLGRGSRFVVRLPLSNASPTPVARELPPAWRSPQGGERVMLVDDNADALTTLAEGLRIVGFTVEVAIDGASALDLAAAFQPDVAVLDIGLPGMDGYVLANALRTMLAPSLKLIALTGYGQPSERQRAFDAGFDAHLVKPVDFPNLLSVIHGQIENRQSVDITP